MVSATVRPLGPLGRVPWVVIVLLLIASVVPSSAAAPPPLPIADGTVVAHGLAAPSIAPGGDGAISLVVGDPLGVPAVATEVSLEVYAFNAYPGNATGPVPAGGPITFTGGGGNGDTFSELLGNIASGSSVPVSVGVAVAGSAPEGLYAIRLAVNFTANGTTYSFESRGFFSDSLWANATELPDRNSTLNLSRLGVSGVVPETGLLVRSDPVGLAVELLLGTSVALAVAGGYYAWRRAPKSRSGASGPAERSADSAFGNNRRSDGD